MKLVFDIGGTHTRVALVSLEGLGPVTRFATPREPGEAVIALIAAAHSLVSHGIESLTGGLAAIVDDEGEVVTSTNLPKWEGYAFAKQLSDGLGVPVVLKNDAELAGLGEAVYGAGKGVHRVAYIGLGTGVGTSLIVDERIQPHSSDGGMRYGVITLADNSTLEERIGGAALSERYHVASAELPAATWMSLTPLLAEGVVNSITAWTPDIVVLGGALMSETNGFSIDAVRGEVARQLPGEATPVVRAVLGDAMGLYGARALLEQAG